MHGYNVVIIILVLSVAVLERVLTREPFAATREAHLSFPTVSSLARRLVSDLLTEGLGICDNGACITSVRGDTGVVDCYE